MLEQHLLEFFARARSSKGGAFLVVVGVLILFAFLLFGLASVAGNVILMVGSAGPVIEFLGTGVGVLVGLAVAVLFILSGVAFMFRATPRPVSFDGKAKQPKPREEFAPALSPAVSESLKQLRTRLREVEQERDEARQGVDALRERFGDDQGAVHWGEFEAVNLSTTLADTELKEQLDELEARNQELEQYKMRYFLRIALKEAHQEGVKIRHGSFGKDDVGHWGIHVRAVLEEALGGLYADLLNRSVWQRIYATSTAEKYHVSDADLEAAFDKALKYVEGLTREIDSTDCPRIEPNFDGKMWLDRQREWFRSDV